MSLDLLRTKNGYLELLWWMVVVVHLGVIWALPIFLTGDGPAHLYSFSVLFQLLGDGAPVLERVFEPNLALVPNWIGTLLLGFLSLTLGFGPGEKTFLSIYVIGFCVGFRVLLGSVDRQFPWSKFLVLPLPFNHLLFIGLYNYLVGVVASMFLLAFGLKHLGRLKPTQAVILSVGFLALYFSHILPAALSGLALIAVHLTRLLARREAFRTWSRELILLCAAGAPSALLAISFLVHQTQGRGLDWGRPPSQRIVELFSGSILVPFQSDPVWWNALGLVIATLVSVKLLVTKLRLRSWNESDGLLPVGLALFVLILFCPESVGSGSIIAYRLGIYLWLAWLLWISFQARFLVASPFPALVLALFFVSGLMQPIDWLRHELRFQNPAKVLNQVASAVPPHSEVWPVVLNPNGRGERGEVLSPRTPLFFHSPLRPLATREDVASRLTYQAEFTIFPIQFKEQGTVRTLGSMEESAYESGGPTPGGPGALGQSEVFLLIVGDLPAVQDRSPLLKTLLSQPRDSVLSLKSDIGLISLYRIEHPSGLGQGG